MSTQLSEGVAGRVTDAMLEVSRAEHVPPERVREEVAAGRAVIPLNHARSNARPAAVGRAFAVKVNANIGCSAELSSRDDELDKLHAALSAGADFVMDLSVGPDAAEMRRAMLAACPAPLGTVPIYEAFSRAAESMEDLSDDLMLDVIREQAAEGVDFMTLHAALLREHVPLATARTLGIVSRGGSILAEWMMLKERQNMLYERWDEVMDICFEHDVTVSLGDGLRPGCLADAGDAAQFAELDVMGLLVRRCRERGVQVMVEGPGHVPFGDIQMNMEREQQVCDNAPFYVLGPVVTDIAPGYDEITSSIGGTAAAYYGAAMLCYVTPAEHLGLPTLEEVRRGVYAARIAAHAGDVARGLPHARERDDAMAKARLDFDWSRQFELALDGASARARYESTRVSADGEHDFCSMCGRKFCAVRTSRRLSGRE